MADSPLLPGLPSYGWRLLITIAAALSALAAVATIIAAFVGAGGSGAASVVAPVTLLVFTAATAVTLIGLAIGARRELAERAAGYSTAFDVQGLALRHPRTGAIVRAADEPTGTLGISRARFRR